MFHNYFIMHEGVANVLILITFWCAMVSYLLCVIVRLIKVTRKKLELYRPAERKLLVAK